MHHRRHGKTSCDQCRTKHLATLGHARRIGRALRLAIATRAIAGSLHGFVAIGHVSHIARGIRSACGRRDAFGVPDAYRDRMHRRPRARHRCNGNRQRDPVDEHDAAQAQCDDPPSSHHARAVPPVKTRSGDVAVKAHPTVSSLTTFAGAMAAANTRPWVTGRRCDRAFKLLSASCPLTPSGLDARPAEPASACPRAGTDCAPATR